MVGLTVLALAGLTVGIGSVVQSGASTAEADRVADAMTVVADPGDVVGTAESELRFGDGTLHTEERTTRVIDADTGDVVERVDSDVLVYEVDDEVVIGGNGAVLRGTGRGATMASAPSIAADRESNGTLLFGAPRLDVGNVSMGTDVATRVRLRTTVEHERRDLGERAVRIAVETDHPRPWAEEFERRGATVVDRSATFDGDDRSSVVAEFDGERRTYLVVHDADVEVTPA